MVCTGDFEALSSSAAKIATVTAAYSVVPNIFIGWSSACTNRVVDGNLASMCLLLTKINGLDSPLTELTSVAVKSHSDHHFGMNRGENANSVSSAHAVMTSCISLISLFFDEGV